MVSTNISQILFKIANLHPFIQIYSHVILVYPIKYISDLACNKFRSMYAFVNHGCKKMVSNGVQTFLK